MASAVLGLLLFSMVGSHTAFFPTIFLACFAIGLGIGNTLMPLLTIAMADVPAADAGLGSGITLWARPTTPEPRPGLLRPQLVADRGQLHPRDLTAQSPFRV